MAASIKINEHDVGVQYGLYILSIPDTGIPKAPNNATPISSRPGLKRGLTEPQAKVLRLSGEIRASSHSTLLSNIDALEKATYYGLNGLRKFSLSLEDYSDRYFEAWCADIQITMAHPRYNGTFANIELTIVIDDPFGIYDTLALSNISGSPFSSPYSGVFTYNGTAIARPRIFCENVGANDITSLSILNTAIRERQKAVTVTASGLKRADGRWGDVKGAAFFDSAGSAYFTTKGNFNPGNFTVFGFIKYITTSPGYFFSTTGDVVRCYYDSGNAKWVFEINGNTCEITDATSGFTNGEWWAICCGYDGSTMYMELYDIEDAEQRFPASQGSVTYTGLPTNTYIGTDASGANNGDKYLDDIRFYNYCIFRDATPSPDPGYRLYQLEEMTAPLPVGRGCTAYFPFDYKASGWGWQNTELTIAVTLSQNELLEIDCERMNVYELGATLTASPISSMSSVSGEFPVLVPGDNGIQIIHNGSASGLKLAIEDKRRFL